jgi:NAD-dependent dihydropyrimidine dehydrogenase PreA subunit
MLYGGSAPRRGDMSRRKWVPYIDVERCKACGICGEVCPHDCLGVIDGIAALVRPDLCRSEGTCVEVCPERAIRMRFMPVDGDSSVGRWHVPHADVRRKAEVSRLRRPSSPFPNLRH